MIREDEYDEIADVTSQYLNSNPTQYPSPQPLTASQSLPIPVPLPVYPKSLSSSQSLPVSDKSSKLSSRVTKWRIVKDEKREEVTHYLVIASDGQWEWPLWRRYQAFLDLHEKISKKYSGLSSFPLRLPKFFVDDDIRNERLVALDKYLRNLPHIALNSEDFKIFLGIYEERDLKPISDGISLKIPDEVKELTNILLSQISTLQLPKSMEVYLPFLLQTATEVLDTFHNMKVELNLIYGIQQRIQYMNRNNDERNYNIKQLTNIHEKISDYMQDETIQNHVIFDVLKCTIAQIEKCIFWNSSLETSLLSEFEGNFKIWDIIKEFELQIESKLTLYLQLEGSDQQKQILEELKELEKSVGHYFTSLAPSRSSKTDPEALRALENLLLIIRKGTARIPSLPQHQARLKDLETATYQTLEKFNQLLLQYNEQAHKALEQELTALSKQAAAFRVSLENELKARKVPPKAAPRSILSSSGPSGAGNPRGSALGSSGPSAPSASEGDGEAIYLQALINQLEDLQENLVDMKYNFDEKFKIVQQHHTHTHKPKLLNNDNDDDL
eukprot:TRINITY_DN22865_c0_g1_i1.p1 TRINITY_DN22865_c0_g1~~TRINITY_DN22865_c0_g1_i1.p1  ORF type:complete len:556 (-),score=150.66 TRINITY_DN22865_c0_g1_i1:20-1687(-)